MGNLFKCICAIVIPNQHNTITSVVAFHASRRASVAIANIATQSQWVKGNICRLLRLASSAHSENGLLHKCRANWPFEQNVMM